MSGFDLFKEVTTSFLPIILSVAAIAISWFFSFTQLRVAETKLNFDVFGKRYEIYEATRSLIDRVKSQDLAKLHPTELRALHLKIQESCFFFDRSTQDFLKDVLIVSDRILLTRDRRKLLDESANESEWRALGKELSADDARLSKMYAQLLPTFEQVMAFTIPVGHARQKEQL